MLLSTFIQKAADTLRQSDSFYGHGTDNAEDEAFALVFDGLDIPYEQDESCLQMSLTEAQIKRVSGLLERRVQQRIPVPYLTHKAWFAGLPFYVDERVLIPRSPLAEWIERQFAPWLVVDEIEHVLDLCTGSGCIAIACSNAFPRASVDAVELCEEALVVANKNVLAHQLQERVHCLQGDLFTPLSGNEVYDLIISNPPYVSDSEIQTLPTEYQHEPIDKALYAPDAGMAIVDQIIKQAAQYLKPGGILVVEVGYSQAVVESRYLHLPLIWLDCSYGGSGIFLISREDLVRYGG